MDKYQIMVEWIESTQDAITELQTWLDWLREWYLIGGEDNPGDFDAAFGRLYKAGLGDSWADGNPAGGGLDALAAAVRGEDLPKPERDLIKAIFGNGGR